MPKILRIINRFNLGGPTYNAAYLTKYLAPEFNTKLIGGLHDSSEESSKFITDNLQIETEIIPEMHRDINYRNDKIAYGKICKIIKDFNPDIVHTHASKAGALGRMAAYRLKVPIIVHTFHGHVFHSYFGKIKTEVFKTFERYLAKKSTAIVAISDIQKKELTQTYRICKDSKVHVIPLGFDLERFSQDRATKRMAFRKKYNMDDETIAIGIIGRLVPIKNHFMFLKAIKELTSLSSKKIKAFIIGDGELKKSIEHQAQTLGIYNNNNLDATIIFTSWIKPIDNAIAGLDIVALTSKNEGTPVSLIEAQAGNKPIVTTAVGGVENIITNYKSGFITPSGDVHAFSLALQKLVDSDELRLKMGIYGFNFVNNCFGYNTLIKNTANLYHQLLQ